METKKVKKGVSLGFKLALIIGSIVLISLGAVTILNSVLVGNDVKVTAEDNNLSINSRSASTVQDKFSTIRSNVFQLLDMISVSAGGRNSAFAKQAESFFFERNQDVAFIYILSADSVSNPKSSDHKLLNNSFFTSNEIESFTVNDFLTANEQSLGRSCAGETIALNASPFFSTPSMALLFPYKENGFDQTCIVGFSIESISDILGTNSTNTTFMINDSDDILSHPDTDRVLVGESLKNHPLVQMVRERNQNNEDARQVVYSETGEDGKPVQYYGAYEKLSFGDILIFTTVPMDLVLETVRNTRTNNIYLTLAVFFISIILVLTYARFGITRPLSRLTRAAEDIQDGNFETHIFDKLRMNRSDEIGVLNKATKAELGFLNTFSKFTNKGVAKAIARNEIDFEPHLKDITIFFSDIRGFTAISDGFKNKFGNDSPREIIGFLNDYMGRMVDCITLSGGNVDKFEGDAIMAVWGILRDDNIDYEKLPENDPKRIEAEKVHMAHVREDAVNAVRGSLAMRYSLMKYNKDAAAFTEAHKDEPRAQYKPHIKIGRGLNTGRATAGIMGSKDKMEYTAIGDAVNFASRTEASNKPCGTDMLITQDTYDLLKMDYIRCKENNFTLKPENEANEIVVEMIPVEFEVKGKGAQHFYGVVNMPNFDIVEFFSKGDPDFVLDDDCAIALGKTGPKTLNEVRTILGIDIPEFEKVNLDEEENKIQIKK
ncbi:MAG: HAMP domain-containing protein [Treponema sp.]|nr:HAMP domain-containing protein [Treponema sp.]